MTTHSESITYILRCHSVFTLPKLKTALLSVSAQTYPAVKALVAVQDLPDDSVAQIKSAVRVLQNENDLDVIVENFSFPLPGDHRGALLNRALTVVQSRYVGFLDYDDVIYPNHAATLIADLVHGVDLDTAASFGGCTLAFYDDIGNGEIRVTSKRMFSKRPSVSSCIVANCFPIHSYVLDLNRFQKVPKFDEESNLHEDYGFLLELLESHPVSTRHVQKPLCEYRLNNNNSNTVSVESKAAAQNQSKADRWAEDKERVERKKAERSFRIPYSEIVKFSDISRLSRQPLLRGMLVCQIAKKLRKRYGVEEARKFLINPKRYSQELPPKKRFLSMRIWF